MALLRLTPRAAPRVLPTARLYHASPSLRMPYKDDQDRESLKPRANEYTKSGSDDEVAADSAAFDPKTTRPETEQAQAGTGKGSGDVLEASPSNQEFSKPRGDENSSNDHGPGQEVRKGGTSRVKSSQKKGDVPGQ